MAVKYENSCDCGKSYAGVNCAHFLSNWMIKNGVMTANPMAGVECCDSGRPIRSKEMASVDLSSGVFEKVLGLSKHTKPPADGSNCYIYAENSGQGHVYFGTKSSCHAGTGSADYHGMSYIRYYY